MTSIGCSNVSLMMDLKPPNSLLAVLFQRMLFLEYNREREQLNLRKRAPLDSSLTTTNRFILFLHDPYTIRHGCSKYNPPSLQTNKNRYRSPFSRLSSSQSMHNFRYFFPSHQPEQNGMLQELHELPLVTQLSQ